LHLSLSLSLSLSSLYQPYHTHLTRVLLCHLIIPPSTPPRQKATYLTRDQRLQAQTLQSISHTYEEITSHLKVTYRQVQGAYQAERPTPKKRRGRLPTLSNTQIKELIKFICQDREL